jgi:hypothetical protein
LYRTRALPRNRKRNNGGVDESDFHVSVQNRIDICLVSGQAPRQSIKWNPTTEQLAALFIPCYCTLTMTMSAYLRVAVLTGFLVAERLAFAPAFAISQSRQQSVSLFLTSDEILARARQATGINVDHDQEEENPKLFDDGVYADIASAYEKLDKRIKEGPGSLTASELKDLEAELARVGEEMKQNKHNRPAKPAPKSENAVAQTPYTAQPTSQTSSSDSATAAEHEGPNGFDGGFGVARGTTNTYALDGMDEMTPEEYQEAIQEAVSARQRQRRAAGVVGNQSAQNYLDAL